MSISFKQKKSIYYFFKVLLSFYLFVLFYVICIESPCNILKHRMIGLKKKRIGSVVHLIKSCTYIVKMDKGRNTTSGILRYGFLYFSVD